VKFLQIYYSNCNNTINIVIISKIFYPAFSYQPSAISQTVRLHDRTTARQHDRTTARPQECTTYIESISKKVTDTKNTIPGRYKLKLKSDEKYLIKHLFGKNHFIHLHPLLRWRVNWKGKRDRLPASEWRVESERVSRKKYLGFFLERRIKVV